MTKCSIEGIFLLASGPVEWPLRAGVAPVEMLFDFRKDDLERMNGLKGRPVTLSLQSNDRTVEVKELWVMETRPGPNPFIYRVRLADRRWFLKYGLIEHDYNIRRNIGFKRVGDNEEETLEEVAPDIWFKAWSMKNPDAAPPAGKWDVQSMLEDVFERAQKAEKDHTGKAPPKVRIAPEVKEASGKQGIEGLLIADSADSGLERALKYVAEAAFYIDLDGSWVVFSRVSGKERELVQLVSPGFTTGTIAEVVANDATRPKAVDVHFEILTEVRVDSLEAASGGTVTAIGKDRRLINVITSTDWELTEADGVPAERSPIVQGTPVPVDDILSYWGPPPGIGGSDANSRLTHEMVQKAFSPFLDLFGALGITGEHEPDADWSSRVNALQNDYRQLFQLNPWITNCLRSIRARRVGLVDIENGTLARSPVYTDYFRIGTQRSFHKSLIDGHTMEYGENVDGYPTGAAVRGVNSLTSNDRPAPAHLSVEDEDNGILRVTYQPDHLRLYQVVLPSKLTRVDGRDLLPSGNPSDRNRSIAIDTVIDAGAVVKLSDEHRLMTIFSGVLATPNDENRLYKIRVEPKDVKDILPQAARAGLQDAKGPVWNVRITGGQEGLMAIVRWVDSRAEDFDKLFGAVEGVPNLKGLVLNASDDGKDDKGAASLNEFAKAIAAQIYARFADHVEGEQTGLFSDKAKLDGWVDEISYKIETNGVAGMTVKFPDKGPELDLWSLMSGSSRAILRREAHAK